VILFEDFNEILVEYNKGGGPVY